MFCISYPLNRLQVDVIPILWMRKIEKIKVPPNEFKISPKLVLMLHTLAVVSAFAWGQLSPCLQLILLDFKTNGQLEKKNWIRQMKKSFFVYLNICFKT